LIIYLTFYSTENNIVNIPIIDTSLPNSLNTAIDGILSNIDTKSLDTSVDAILSNIDTKNPVVVTPGDLWGIGAFSAQMLSTIKEFFGVEWWATVVIVAGLFRLIIFPLTLYAFKQGQKFIALKGEFDAIRAKYQKGWSIKPESMVAYKAEMAELNKRHGLSMWKRLIPILLQIPLFIFLAMGVRRLIVTNYEELKVGGLWFFTDLTANDTYLRLPIISSLFSLLTIEINRHYAPVGVAPPQWSIWLGRTFAFLAIPVSLFFPMSLQVYMISTAFLTMVQTLALNHPRMKRIFGVAVVEKKSTTQDQSIIPIAYSRTNKVEENKIIPKK